MTTETKKISKKSGFENDLLILQRNLYLNFSDLDELFAGDNISDLRDMLTHRPELVKGAVLEDLVEGQRELAIFDVLTGAKTLAEKGNKECMKYLETALNMVWMSLGDYKFSISRYAWLDSSISKIREVYEQNKK